MYHIKMKTGGNIYPVTANLLRHNESQVVILNDDKTVRRVVDPTEYANMTVEEMNTASVAEKINTKKKSSKKKAKKEPEAEAPALENIDVSSL